MASTSGTSSGGPPPEKTKAEIKKLIQGITASGEAIDGDFMIKLVDEVSKLMEGGGNNSPESPVRVHNDSSEDDNKIPDEFICPITKQMMSDPVTIASGQTFDRSAIVNWRKSGKRTCPVTEKFLSHQALTPNYLLRKFISKWCRRHGMPKPAEPLVEEQPPTNEDRQQLSSLHMKLNNMGPSEQKAAAIDLRQLTKEKPALRALYAEGDAEGDENLSQLFQLFFRSGEDNKIEPSTHTVMLTVVLNIIKDEKNKKAVAEFHMSIPVLIKSLEGRDVYIRCKAAEIISEMSSLDSNKELIGNSDALRLLIDLLKVNGFEKATRDAIRAISILCENDKNLKQTVELGAVFVVAEKMKNKKFMDELLNVLGRFSIHKQACAELEVLEFAGVLLSIVKNDPSKVRKETAIMILHNVLVNNREKWKNMVRGAEVRATIIEISESGTSIAKIKAKAILERLTAISESSSVPPP